VPRGETCRTADRAVEIADEIGWPWPSSRWTGVTDIAAGLRSFFPSAFTTPPVLPEELQQAAAVR
jgi:hypothetical protein